MVIANHMAEYSDLDQIWFVVTLNLPQPNYTVNTLAHLEEKYADHEFALIMGEDNLKSFHKWKNYQVLLFVKP